MTAIALLAIGLLAGARLGAVRAMLLLVLLSPIVPAASVLASLLDHQPLVSSLGLAIVRLMAVEVGLLLGAALTVSCGFFFDRRARRLPR